MTKQDEIDVRLEDIANLESRKIQLEKIILKKRLELEALVKGGSHVDCAPEHL